MEGGVNENEHVLVKVSIKVIQSIYDFERIMLFKWSRKSYLASIQVTHRRKTIIFHSVDNYWYNVYFFHLNNCMFLFVTSAQDRIIKVL